MTANMTKEAPTFSTGSVLEQAKKNQPTVIPHTSQPSDSNSFHQYRITLPPDISKEHHVLYINCRHQLFYHFYHVTCHGVAPLAESFLALCLPYSLSDAVFFLGGGNSAEYFLYLSTTKALDGPSQAQLRLCLSWYHASNSYVPTCPNTSQPFTLKDPMVDSDSNGGNKGKHMDNYGYIWHLWFGYPMISSPILSIFLGLTKSQVSHGTSTTRILSPRRLRGKCDQVQVLWVDP